MEELKEGWRLENLEENLEVILDYRGKTPQKSEKGRVTLSAKSVKMGYIDYSNIYYVSEETYSKFMTRGLPKKGDILLTTEAPLGCVAELKDDSVCLAQRLITLRGKKEKLNNKYLLYYLQSPRGQYELLSKATGTTVQGIKRTEFSKVKILMPSLEKQNKIASILSSLDEKIELNRKINQNLEETAQTLFKRWFIDFEFPNEEGKPYKSSGGKMIESELGEIPEGWRVGKLGEIVKIKNGYSYKGKELMQSENAMLTIKNFNRDGSFKIDGYKEISLGEKVKESHYVEIGDILVAHTDLTQGAEIIGNPIMVFSKANYKKIIMSMDLVKVETKYKNFIYFLLKDKRFKNHALGYINGTTVLHLNKNCISEYKFVLPIENKLIEKLEKYLQKINLQICINQKEIEKLIELRDYLLPRLMSGEISV